LSDQSSWTTDPQVVAVLNNLRENGLVEADTVELSLDGIGLLDNLLGVLAMSTKAASDVMESRMAIVDRPQGTPEEVIPAAVHVLAVQFAHGLNDYMILRADVRCRVCGCSTFKPCDGGCEWVEEDLCSACAEKKVEIVIPSGSMS
jgi:hypothetical protein